jgi:transcriptional regulator with XRE-family HTH domain
MIREAGIGLFVKYSRRKQSMSQEELAERTGVPLRFIRDIEQGKDSLGIDKLQNILQFLGGYRLAPVSIEIDPYQMWYNFKEKPVRILLKDRRETSGFLAAEVLDERGLITAWKLVPLEEMAKWRRSRENLPIKIIRHSEIEKIDFFNHEQVGKSFST